MKEIANAPGKETEQYILNISYIKNILFLYLLYSCIYYIFELWGGETDFLQSFITAKIWVANWVLLCDFRVCS